MKTTQIQELTVPRVALGTWSWGFGGVAGGDTIFGNQFDEADLKPVFDKAMSLGLTLWDTATVYASGASETILGKFVEKEPMAIISTKFTPALAYKKGDSAVEEFLEASLKRLHRDVIDIYWIHNTDDIERWTPKLIPLLKAGKVKKVGVSNHNLEQLKYCNELLKEAGFQVHAIQNHYSLLYRNIEDTGMLDYCKENNIAVFSYMVLEQGALGGKYSVKNPLPTGTRRGEAFPPAVLEKMESLFVALRELSQTYGVTVAQLATAWAINKGTIPIVGVTKVAQVEEAAQAADIVLTAEEIKILDDAAIKTGVTVKGEWEESM